MPTEDLDPGDGVRPLDVDYPADVRAVASMHAAHFPEATEVRCGHRFMTRFYFPFLIRRGWMGCLVARRDGQIVAYLTYTKFPRRILKAAVRERPLYVLWNVALACLTQFDAIMAITKHARAAFQPSAASGAPTIPPDAGEVLFLAAMPEHQTWMPPGGDARVTARLFAEAQDRFRAEGVSRVLLVVRKTNTASMLFCHSMGCSIDKTASHPVYHHFWHDIPEVDEA